MQVLNRDGKRLAAGLYNPIEKKSMELLGEFLSGGDQSTTRLSESFQWGLREVVGENLPKLPNDKKGKTVEREPIIKGVATNVRSVILMFRERLLTESGERDGLTPSFSLTLRKTGMGSDSKTSDVERGLYEAGHPHMRGHEHANSSQQNENLLVLRARERQAGLIHKVLSRLPKAIDVTFKQFVRAGVDEALGPFFPGQDVLNEYRGNSQNAGQKYQEARQAMHARSKLNEVQWNPAPLAAEYVEE